MAGRTSQAGRGRGAPASRGDASARGGQSARQAGQSGRGSQAGQANQGSRSRAGGDPGPTEARRGRGSRAGRSARADEDSGEHPMPGTKRGTPRGTPRGTTRTNSRARKIAPAPRRSVGSSAARRRTGSQLTPLGVLFKGLAALWMGLAHAVGWVARAVGRKAATARELDPEHRRDGAGLALIGLAVLLGAAIWFRSAGPVGRWLAQICHTFFGSLS